jgi:predicted AAA+ superfamily ATPase
MGARQVGKTTLARQIAADRELAYHSLDDREVRRQAQEDPEGLIESVASSGAVFDEVQRAPDLLLAMKAVVDRENRTGRFLLTGSNQPHLSARLADSLVGRVAYRPIRPLTLSEQRYDVSPRHWSWFFDLSPAELEQRLHEAVAMSGALDWRAVVATGGMPRALARGVEPGDRRQILDDYVKTFAQRDVREILQVESPARLEQLFRLLAARTGMELNFSTISRDLGQSVSTIRRWTDAFERTYLVTLVPAFSPNSSTRVIRAPKLFIADSALAMASSQDVQPSGFHFETLVANDLLVWRDEVPGRTVSHWRIASGPEVDFVIGHEQRVVPIEIKAAESVGKGDARHLATFLTRYDESRMGVLLSADPEIRWIHEGILATPWWAVL